MEDSQSTQEPIQPIVEERRTPEVGFPMAPQPKAKSQGGKLIFIGLGLLILSGLGIFLFARGSKEETTKITPTPTQTTSTPVPTENGSPTPTSIDKTKVKIEIQNGTGVAGEAAYLQGKLKTAGYSLISVGNATTQNATTTTVTFAKSLSATIVSDLTKQLEAIYTKVETKTSSTQTNDATIVTGSRTGVTPKPTATPTGTTTPTTIE
jgi:hypothetical protein